MNGGKDGQLLARIDGKWQWVDGRAVGVGEQATTTDREPTDRDVVADAAAESFIHDGVDMTDAHRATERVVQAMARQVERLTRFAEHMAEAYGVDASVALGAFDTTASVDERSRQLAGKGEYPALAPAADPKALPPRQEGT